MGGLIHLIGGSRCVGGPGLRPSDNRTQRLVKREGEATETLQDSYFNPQIKITTSVLDGRSGRLRQRFFFFCPLILTDRGFECKWWLVFLICKEMWRQLCSRLATQRIQNSADKYIYIYILIYGCKKGEA